MKKFISPSVLFCSDITQNHFSRLLVILDAEPLGFQDPKSAGVAVPNAQVQAPSGPFSSHNAPQHDTNAGSYGRPPQAPPATTYQPYQQQQTPPVSSYGGNSGYGSSGYGSTKPMPSSYGSTVNSRPVMKDENAGTTILPIMAINPYSNKLVLQCIAMRFLFF